MALTFQDDMDNIFLNSGFEEEITYTPSGGSAKTIRAIVFREGATERDRNVRGIRTSDRRYDLEILISTDATNGIETVTVNEDVITVKPHIGDASARTFTVAGIVQNDAGAHRLRLK